MSYRIDISGQPDHKSQKTQEAFEKDLVKKVREFVQTIDGVVSAHVSANTLEGGLETIVENNA